jgi:hypothetical protein
LPDSNQNPQMDPWQGTIGLVLANPGVTNRLSHLRMAYMGYGLYVGGGGSVELSHVQFTHVPWPVYVEDQVNLRLRNALIWDVPGAVFSYYNVGNTTAVEQATIHTAAALYSGWTNWSSLAMTNCLLVQVDDITTLPGPFLTNMVAVLDSSDGVFTNGGAGYHYLAGPQYRANGTTNITPALLADIGKLTTYPPVIYHNVTLTNDLSLTPQAARNAGQPDLGYHYFPIDYAFGGVTLNANMNVAPGTVLAWYRTSSGWYHAGHGIHLADGKKAVFDGRAEAPAWWIRRNTVQEMETSGFTYGAGGMTGWASQLSQAPEINARFTRFSQLAGDCGNHYRDDYGFLKARVTHSEFWGGSVGGYWRASYYTNCLFERTQVHLVTGSTGVDLVLRNCTIFGGALYVSRQQSVGLGLVSIRDTVFDGTNIDPPTDAYSYNTNLTDYAYNTFTNGGTRLWPTNANDQLLTNFVWQTGPLGRFYLPTNSVVIDSGSRNATNAGLYHFTTQVAQTKEGTSLVDRAYHYIALDANGNPVDTDEDGIFDYIEDFNGNGVLDQALLETDWQTYTTITNNLPGLQVFTPLK